jgi:hypothetical protein
VVGIVGVVVGALQTLIGRVGSTASGPQVSPRVLHSVDDAQSWIGPIGVVGHGPDWHDVVIVIAAQHTSAPEHCCALVHVIPAAPLELPLVLEPPPPLLLEPPPGWTPLLETPPLPPPALPPLLLPLLLEVVSPPIEPPASSSAFEASGLDPEPESSLPPQAQVASAARARAHDRCPR